MFPFSSYYGLGDPYSSGSGTLLQVVRRSSSVEMMDGISSLSSRTAAAEAAEEKAAAASKSHSEAERRRRERINGHLATLRTLLPNTTKMDKASVLAEVVKHVKDLKKLAADDVSSLPGEVDEVTLDYCDEEEKLIRASLCCEDQPELLRDLTKALRSVEGKVRAVKVEIETVGGRTKSVIVVERRSSLCGGAEGERGAEDDLGELRSVLRGVVYKSASAASAKVVPRNKRLRLS